MIREARLKPEFASLYPALQPGVWCPASEAAAQLLAMMQRADAAFEKRVMHERHFEFRGGVASAVRAGARSRLADRGGG